jgi:superfamily II DNA or RNA helicase
VEHAARVAALVNDAMGSEVAAVVTGGTAKGKRKKTMDAVRAGDLACFVGTVGKEGFDAPAVDTLALTTPLNPRSQGDLLQFCGRALRPAPGKMARILDFIDAWGPFRGWAAGRAKVFRGLEWKIVDFAKPLARGEE